MAIYPKKKILHYAKGGAFKTIGDAFNSENGAFNKPGTFVGLTYTPTMPELPDMEGIAYLEQSKANAEARLAEERAKRNPDMEKIYSGIKDIKALTGQIGEVESAFQSLYSDFVNKTKQDENYVFSQEGRQHIHELNNFFSRDKISRLQNNYDIVKRQRDAIDKNNRGNQIFIKNNNVMAYNTETGEAEYVSIKDISRLGPQYKIMTNNDVLNFYDKNVGYGFSGFEDVASGMNEKDFRDFINDEFNGLGKTVVEAANAVGIQMIGNVPTRADYQKIITQNATQREAIGRYIRNNMPIEAHNYLVQEYIRQNGNFNESDFNKNLVKMINEKSIGYEIYEEKTDRNYTNIPEWASSLVQGDGGYEYNATPVRGFFGVNKDKTMIGRWMPWSDGNSLNVYINQQSDKPFDRRKQDYYAIQSPGGAYVFGDTDVGVPTSSNDGSKIKSVNLLTDVTINGYYTGFVFTGEVLNANNNEAKGHKYKSGNMVIHGKNLHVPEGFVDPKQDELSGKWYFLDKDGNKVFVAERAFTVVSGKAPKGSGFNSDVTAFIPMTMSESVRAFNWDYSGEGGEPKEIIDHKKYRETILNFDTRKVEDARAGRIPISKESMSDIEILSATNSVDIKDLPLTAEGINVLSWYSDFLAQNASNGKQFTEEAEIIDNLMQNFYVDENARRQLYGKILRIREDFKINALKRNQTQFKQERNIPVSFIQ